jgi:hypothetical protein
MGRPGRTGRPPDLYRTYELIDWDAAREQALEQNQPEPARIRCEGDRRLRRRGQ